jgi:hypothetical protein
VQSSDCPKCDLDLKKTCMQISPLISVHNVKKRTVFLDQISSVLLRFGCYQSGHVVKLYVGRRRFLDLILTVNS